MSIELLDEPKTSTELTVQQRAAVALNAMQARIDLAAQVKKSENVKEIKNEAVSRLESIEDWSTEDLQF